MNKQLEKTFEAITGLSLGNTITNQMLFIEWDSGDKEQTFIEFWLEETGYTAKDPEFQEVMKFILTI